MHANFLETTALQSAVFPFAKYPLSLLLAAETDNPISTKPTLQSNKIHAVQDGRVLTT